MSASRSADLMRLPTCTEQPVADQVTAAVVDGLEPIEIEIEHHERRSIAFEPRDTLFQMLGELGAVEKPGQRVVVGKVVDAPFGVLFGGDVGRRADVAGVVAALVEGRLSRQPPETLAAGDRDLHLDAAEGRMLFDVVPKLFEDRVAFLTDRSQEIVEAQADQLFPRYLRCRREAFGDALEAPAAVEFPQPVAGVLLELLEQQADDVLLVAYLGAADQMVNEVAGVADADEGHDQRIDRQQRCQRQALQGVSRPTTATNEPASNGALKARAACGRINSAKPDAQSTPAMTMPVVMASTGRRSAKAGSAGRPRPSPRMPNSGKRRGRHSPTASCPRRCA